MVMGCKLRSHDMATGQRRRLPRMRIRLGSVPSLMLCLAALLVFCGTTEALAMQRRMPNGIATVEGRQDPLPGGDSSGSSSSAAASTTDSAKSTSVIERPSSTSAAASGSGTTSSTLPTLTARPKVFDAGLGSNFTSNSCPTFLQGLNNNDSFNNCLPLSLLLQQSKSFFEESSTMEGLTAILDLTCNVVFPSCQTLMEDLAEQLLDTANCGGDYQLDNPVVMLAYYGLISYTPLYQAGCLKASSADEVGNGSNPNTTSDSASSNQYCFVSAANSSQPADSYVYSLPLGNALPGSSRPTCSSCLQQTMSYFATAAANATSPLSGDYDSAATQINSGCGPTFVDQHVAIDKSTENAASPSVQLRTGWAVLAVFVSCFLMA